MSAELDLGKITIKSERLQAEQRRFAILMIVLPLVGTIVALAWAWQSGIGAVEIGLFLTFYALTTIGATVGFHRHFAHKAFEAAPQVRWLLAVLGSMAAQGPVVYWVATHRRHHQLSDRPGDPHSPHLHGPGIKGWIQGQWYAHISWLYKSEMTNPARYAKDVLRDPMLVKINQQYIFWVLFGLALPTVLGGLLTWSWIGLVKGFLWGGMVRLFVVHHSFWAIGGIAHTFGTRPFTTQDFSVNNFLTALPNFGEGWHNNHHAFPNSAHFGLWWWQIDVGAWTVMAMEKLGVVWDVKRPTLEMIAAKRRA